MACDYCPKSSCRSVVIDGRNINKYPVIHPSSSPRGRSCQLLGICTGVLRGGAHSWAVESRKRELGGRNKDLARRPNKMPQTSEPASRRGLEHLFGAAGRNTAPPKPGRDIPERSFARGHVGASEVVVGAGADSLVLK